MDIEIQDMNSTEIILVLTRYPRGKLEIKYGRVFWCSDMIEPMNRESPVPPGRFPPVRRKSQAENVARGMSDALGRFI